MTKPKEPRLSRREVEYITLRKYHNKNTEAQIRYNINVKIDNCREFLTTIHKSKLSNKFNIPSKLSGYGLTIQNEPDIIEEIRRAKDEYKKTKEIKKQ
ncbi:MAG: hypothetical protein NTW30_03660 [Candidatus Aenigmarchaeota archaeon]|nr:hypothetical protein [Candidatus Aenigmarchaeota archaeon]